MPIIDVEGQQFEVPNGTSDKVIGQIIRENFQQGAQDQPQPGALDRISEDINKRGAVVGKSLEQIGSDIITPNPIEAGIALSQGARRIGGAVAGVAGNLIGEGVSAVGRGVASVTPEDIKQSVKDFANNLIESSFGKGVSDAIKGGVETFSEFEKTNPEVAQDVKDVFNMGLLISPIKGGAAAKTATKQAVDKTLENALTKGKVLTSDVIPPKTFVGKSVQKLTERIPVVGTGGVRKAQQTSRGESLNNIAKEFNIDAGSAFEKDIVESANKIFNKSQARAGELRTQAIAELNKIGTVKPTKAITEINKQIKSITELGARGDKELLSTLRNIKGELSGNFERMKDIRTTIFNDVADVAGNKNAIKTGGDAALNKVAGALSGDLDNFANVASKAAVDNKDLAKASSKWKASNRIFKDNFAKARDTELKRALTKGNVQPEVINTTIRGGKLSELNRLHANLDVGGRKSVMQLIIKNALEKADGNPTLFLNELNRVNNKRALNIFFKGKARREIDGLKKFLNITRRAQDAAASIASQSEVSSLGFIGGAAIAPKPVIAVGATIGLLGRAYESKPVRDLLIKLSRTPAGTKKANEMVSKIRLLLAASAETARTKEGK